MTAPEPLSSVADVVAAFGGIPGMTALGYSEQQVKMWISRQKFSHPVRSRILVEASKRGLNLAPELLGLEAAA